MIFVDTSAWYASVVPDDPEHNAARDWLATNSEPLVTTDYIIDETLTLLRARGQHRRALAMGEEFFASRLATVHYVTSAGTASGWRIFRTYGDKRWSFTDCVSKAVMEELRLTVAFAFDEHFQQFGGVQVVPHCPA